MLLFSFNKYASKCQIDGEENQLNTQMGLWGSVEGMYLGGLRGILVHTQIVFRSKRSSLFKVLQIFIWDEEVALKFSDPSYLKLMEGRILIKTVFQNSTSIPSFLEEEIIHGTLFITKTLLLM